MNAPKTQAAVARRTRMADRMTEDQFLVQIRDLAKLLGWKFYHTHDSRGSDAGWPNVVLAKGARVIFAELKSQTGKPTDGQIAWLHSLADAGNETALWRPADLEDIKAILLGRRITTTPKEASTQ